MLKDVLFYSLLGIALALIISGDILAPRFVGFVLLLIGIAIATGCLISTYVDKRSLRKTK